MVKVVYFNQWFSSIGYVIDGIKEKYGNDFKIIASSKNPNHAYKNSVDIFIVENHDDSDEEYLKFIEDVILKYHVDIFFVKKNARLIMENKNRLVKSNAILVYEDFETILTTEKKSNVYDTLYKINSLKKIIPGYLVSDNKEELCSEILDNSNICLKLDKDEGGASFRHISDEPVDFNSLYKFRVNKITSDEAINIVNSASDCSKLLIMDMLDSPEISVDCYNSKQGFMAICRKKTNGREQFIYVDPEIKEICYKICTLYNLRFPFNVQFRYNKDSKKDNSNLKLLEINTRLSGGSHYLAKVGLNLAEICLLDLTHNQDRYDIKSFDNFKERHLTYIEQAIDLD